MPSPASAAAAPLLPDLTPPGDSKLRFAQLRVAQVRVRW